jgi:hypothetical protein
MVRSDVRGQQLVIPALPRLVSLDVVGSHYVESVRFTDGARFDAVEQLIIETSELLQFRTALFPSVVELDLHSSNATEFAEACKLHNGLRKFSYAGPAVDTALLASAPFALSITQLAISAESFGDAPLLTIAKSCPNLEKLRLMGIAPPKASEVVALAGLKNLQRLILAILWTLVHPSKDLSAAFAELAQTPGAAPFR